MPLTGEAKREYQRNWLKSRRDAWFAENGPCVECGSWDRLELNHVDPALKDSRLRASGTGAVWSWSKARLSAELAKCVVKCYDCHKRKSSTEKAQGTDVGSSKITDQDVEEIKALYATGNYTHRQLSQMYGIHYTNIGRVIRIVSWNG